MILIIGGAYQGKTTYAADHFPVTSVFDCRPAEDAALGQAAAPDFSADLICGIDAFVRRCTEAGEDAVDYFRLRQAQWQDRILVMRDVSCGVVPMDKQTRAFREMNGRLMQYLAGEADQVIRVFCGIGKVLAQRPLA